jgi:hypothetical protein
MSNNIDEDHHWALFFDPHLASLLSVSLILDVGRSWNRLQHELGVASYLVQS